MLGLDRGRDTMPLNQLFDRGTAAACDDGQLLGRFADRRDEAAFAALVARHGPMVWATARAVLRHEHDAEDAFQATFLTLARRAGSVRSGASLAAWLHRVAHRAAVAAGRAARRRHEAEAACPPRPATTRPTVEPDLAATVRAEVAALPEASRLPVLLCDLEGLTYHEAAARLGWTEPTLRNRLAGARARLKTRLARRGLANAVPFAAHFAPGRLVVPAALVRATIGLALGRGVPSSVVAAVAQATGRRLILGPLKVAIAAAALVALGHAGPSAPPVEAPATATPSVPAPPVEDVVVRGRVIDPAGRPVAGAVVRTLANYNHPAPAPVVTSAADGTFALPVATRFRQAEPMSRFRGLVATAAGFGPGWTLDTLRPDVVIRLVVEGPPIEGRIIDAAQRPVAGATVEVANLFAPLLQTDKVESGSLAAYLAAPPTSSIGSGTLWLPAAPTSTTTDGDGRFRLAGFGPERLVVLIVRQPAIVTTRLYVATRGGEPITASRQDMVWTRPYTFQPARFEQAIASSRVVQGVVTDFATGRPLAGWKVEGANHESTDEVADDVAAVTGPDGRYTLTGLPADKAYRVFLVPPPGQPYLAAGYLKVPAPPDGGAVTVDHAARRGVVVRGRITDGATGAPLAGSVNAEALRANPRIEDFAGYAASRIVYRYTDADGRYEAVVPPGPGVLGFRAAEEGRFRSGQGFDALAGPGGDPTFLRAVGRDFGRGNYHILAGVDPAPGAEGITLDLAVGAGRTIELAVVDPEGRAVAGTEVEGADDFLANIPRWQDSATIALSGFEPGGSRRVTVRHPGRKLVGSLIVREEAGPRQTLHLAPWGEIQGRIVREDGTPRVGLDLTSGIGSDRPPVEPSGLLPRSNGLGGITTDSGARFHVVGLVPGLHYAAAAAENREILVGDLFEDVTVAPGEVKDLGDLKVRPFPPRPAGGKP